MWSFREKIQYFISINAAATIPWKFDVSRPSFDGEQRDTMQINHTRWWLIIIEFVGTSSVVAALYSLYQLQQSEWGTMEEAAAFITDLPSFVVELQICPWKQFSLTYTFNHLSEKAPPHHPSEIELGPSPSTCMSAWGSRGLGTFNRPNRELTSEVYISEQRISQSWNESRSRKQAF